MRAVSVFPLDEFRLALKKVYCKISDWASYKP